MRTRLPLLLVLALASTPSGAYWIRHCETTPRWSTQVERVADLNPGAADTVDELFGFAQVHEHMIAYKGALYFQADDGKTGPELWRVVGGGAPTLVADLVPGSGGSAPHAFAILGDVLHFAATTPQTGEEIFRFNGASIQLAAETAPGPDGEEITGLTPFKGAIYFTRGDGPVGGSVWRYANATAAPVASINALDGWMEDFSTVAETYVTFKNRLYFVRNSHPENYQLWAFDGTTPTKVKTLEGDELTSRDFEMGVDTSTGHLYFGSVIPGEYPFDTDELWRYDGQNPPVKIKTFDDWTAYSYSQPSNFAMFQGRLHFTAAGRLFRIDGATLHEYPSGANGVPRWPDHLSVFDAVHQLYMAGFYDDWTQDEPYLFDGANAALIKDIMPADAEYGGSFPSPAVDIGNTLFFYAEDDVHGRELWRVVAKEGVPMLECDIVVAPIWVDKRLWVMDRPEVIVATWRVTTGGEPELLSRETVAVRRNKEIRVPVLKVKAQGREPAAPFALASLVYNRATGEVIDQGFDVVGTASPEVRRELDRMAATLLKTQRAQAHRAEPPARKDVPMRLQRKG